MDNLASMTYEVFEKDPVKYKQYEQVCYFFTIVAHLMLKVEHRQCIKHSWTGPPIPLRKAIFLLDKPSLTRSL